MFKIIIFVSSCFIFATTYGQGATITGTVSSAGEPVPFVNIYLEQTQIGTSSNELGFYELNNIAAGRYTLIASTIGFDRFRTTLTIKSGKDQLVEIELKPSVESLDEMVVTGTLKPVSRLESPVPVEVYKPAFFKKNPTASIFEALQNVNGVRPQINSNVLIPLS